MFNRIRRRVRRLIEPNVAAAERLANVVLKQQPNAELLPRPRDLYSHQLVV